MGFFCLGDVLLKTALFDLNKVYYSAPFFFSRFIAVESSGFAEIGSGLGRTKIIFIAFQKFGTFIKNIYIFEIRCVYRFILTDERYL